jgi:hypothetical protein
MPKYKFICSHCGALAEDGKRWAVRAGWVLEYFDLRGKDEVKGGPLCCACVKAIGVQYSYVTRRYLLVSPVLERWPNPLDIPLRELCLETRTRNALWNAGLKDGRIQTLLRISPAHLLKAQNFGRKSMLDLTLGCQRYIPDFVIGSDVPETLNAFLNSTAFDYPGHEEEASKIITSWELWKRERSA